MVDIVEVAAVVVDEVVGAVVVYVDAEVEVVGVAVVVL